MQQEKATGRIVPAVDRAARILKLIEASARPLSITEIARQLDASKGTVREILETLRGHGLLERDEDTKLYRLGPQLARLGASSRERLDLVAAARPYLAALSQSQREIVVLLVPQEDRLMIQEAFEPTEPRGPILVSATPGRSFPISAGACGKVVMAWGDAQTRAALRSSIGDKPLPSDDEMATVVASGYALDDQEFMDGVRGVSAPILGPGGQLVGLVLVSGIVASLQLEQLDAVGAATRNAADAVSEAIGGSGVTAPGSAAAIADAS